LGDPRQLIRDLYQPPIRLIEALSQGVNRDDDPICVSTFSFVHGWRWLANDGFLGNGRDFSSEAGDLGLHNPTAPLHLFGLF